MAFYHTFVLLAALFSPASSSPVDANSVPRVKFSVKQVAVVARNPHALPVLAMQAYDKYASLGAVAPSSLASAAAAAKQSGSVSAVPQTNDNSYLSPVNVGGQTLMLDFDTGSSDLWVFSTLTPQNQRSGQATYNPAKSANAKKLPGYTWEISYGDGSGAGGVVYADTVRVGGVTATSQAVEAATEVSRTFANDGDTDGLLGLAFSKINTVVPQKQKTFFGTVAPTLKSKLFTADLKYRAPGTYDFGFIDSSKYTGKITYVPVNTTDGYWQIDAGSFAIGDYVSAGTLSTASFAQGSIGAAIVDTGTTLLYLPSKFVSMYYAPVQGAKFDQQTGGWIFPCKSNLPSLGISIGKGFFVVPSIYINYARLSKESKMCYGGLQPSSGLPFSILGDIFLKAQFAIFDQTQAKPRVGFASKSV